MQSRPTGILGLTIHLAKMRWAAMGRGTKLALMATLLVGGLAAASYSSCLLRSACGAGSASCPYSSAAAQSSPCDR